MAQPGPYQIHTTDGKQPYVFHTVATSSAQAEKSFRKQHPRWRRPIKVVPPIPSDSQKGKA